ncbi:MAG TPA: prolipoprotein diacylglyceryl transferase family protein [Gemmatimonadaceae bacterium]|jgi:phosphatidylglycerol:prolipoprotein diacylglycerol transferase|nr:prolipoprotein diacylglyceryl transferase family protein [Gemmatimonadaceae bacterium]
MRPILFYWRGRPIYSYPAMLYVGLVFGIVAGNAAAHAEDANAFAVFVATFALLVPALFGARLLFVATHWEQFRADPLRIFRRDEGGAAQYGALFIAIPLSIPVLRALGLGLGTFWDAAAFTILVGMAFTRIGCFLNGCCAGRPTRWGIRLPNRSGTWERRVPTQLFEAALALLLLVLAVAAWPTRPFSGAVFLLVAGGYGVGRLVLETLRERPPGRGVFSVHHAISLIMVITALTVLGQRWGLHGQP